MATQQEIENSRLTSGYRYYRIHPASYVSLSSNLNIAKNFPTPLAAFGTAASSSPRARPGDRVSPAAVKFHARIVSMLPAFAFTKKQVGTGWALVKVREAFLDAACQAVISAVAANRLGELTKAEFEAAAS